MKSGEKPADIPSNAHTAYKDEWRGMGDWLGSGNRRGRVRSNWRPFAEARKFVRSLGLQSLKEWEAYAGSGERASDIPSAPKLVYKDEWRGMGDWLGTVNAWNRAALLALLEDIRPNLESLERVMNLGKNRIGMRLPRSPWFPCDLRFPHS